MKSLTIVFIDLCIIFGSFLLSFYLLDTRGLLIDYVYNLQAFEILSPLIGVFYLLYMYIFGLYNSTRYKLQQITYTVFLISVALLVSIMAACFFVRDGALSFPRSVLLSSAVFYFTLLTVWRAIVWKAAKKIHGVKKVCLVGDHDGTISEILSTRHKDIYRVLHSCSEDNPSLMGVIRDVDEVFLSPTVTDAMRERIIDRAVECNRGVYFVPKYADISIMNSVMRKIDDIPTFYIEKPELTIEERVVKRSFDLLLASVGSLIALPIGVVVALLVKTDGGPVFYSQERLTKDGRKFDVHKFRTMKPNAELLSGPVLAGKHDPRITRVGRFIRATRLDELPQLWNILNGDMSIVGPRPERPFFTEQFKSKMPEYRHRLKVKAGLTGLAQIMGKYNTEATEKLRYDLIYINNYSLLQDLLIVLKTVKVLFLKESTEGTES